MNRGVGVAKYTGSRGKSGSNDANAEFVAQVRKIFDDNGVIVADWRSWARWTRAVAAPWRWIDPPA